MWKRALFLMLLAVGFITTSAQVGIRLVQLRPTGELGATMEKCISAEILYIEDFDDKWRTRASLGYFHMQPRLAVFPITGSIYDSQGFRVLPGTQTFSKWNMTFLTMGMDRALVHLAGGKLTLYPGMDILIGGINAAYESHTPGISDDSFSGGYLLGGLRFRAGADYALSDHLAIYLEACRAYYAVQEIGWTDHNEIGLGARYTF